PTVWLICQAPPQWSRPVIGRTTLGEYSLTTAESKAAMEPTGYRSDDPGEMIVFNDGSTGRNGADRLSVGRQGGRRLYEPRGLPGRNGADRLSVGRRAAPRAPAVPAAAAME